MRVVCRCRPARSDLLRGHGQGGFDGRTDEEKAAGKPKPNTNKRSTLPPSSKRASTTNLATQQHHNLDALLGIRFAPDGKSISVIEQASSVGNTKEAVRAKPHPFTFDHVFDPNCTQADVFDQLAKDTVNDVLRGYNGSIFACQSSLLYGDIRGCTARQLWWGGDRLMLTRVRLCRCMCCIRWSNGQWKDIHYVRSIQCRQ